MEFIFQEMLSSRFRHILFIGTSDTSKILLHSDPSDGMMELSAQRLHLGIFHSAVVSMFLLECDIVLTPLGSYTCVGKQLAKHELRIVISRLVFGFDFSFADEQNARDFANDQRNTFPLTVPSLMMKVSSRMVN